MSAEPRSSQEDRERPALTRSGRPARRAFRRPRRRTLLAVLGLLVTLVALSGAFLVRQLAADLPSPGTLHARTSSDTSKIFDRNGALLFEVLDPRAGRRTRVPLAELPPELLQAVIAVEDAGFRRNPGVDARGIARAAWQMLRERRIVSGGSTITQQLARQVLLSEEERVERSFRRKLREMILALGITAAYSKDEILEMYLNEVYFGQLAYGVEAAAQTYLGKPAAALDLAECALLAGLIQSPAASNPLVNIDAARARQALVLERMVAAGFVDRQAAELAAAEELGLTGDGAPLLAPHFVAWVRNTLEARYGPERVNGGGLYVVTSLDLDLQRRAEAIVRQRMARLQERRPGKPDHDATDAALVALDPATGQVLAMVGSADYFDASIDGAVNVALALRQPGSSIKPLTYAAAFDVSRWGLPEPATLTAAGAARREQGEAGLRPPFTPATVLSDLPTSFPTREGEPYRPLNFDRMWRGPISLRRALATSSNLVAVKVLQAVGVDALIDTAEALGITTFGRRERYGLALTLGGGDVRLLELTAAFAGLAAGGHRVSPNAILGVMDAPTFRARMAEDGAGLAELRAQASLSAEPVIPPAVAYLVTDILADDQARLPAFGEGSVLALGRPAAAKTGTTTDFRDNWTVGYTPDLAVGVWLGNADNRPMRFISGITGAGPIWHDFMQAAHRGLPARAFPRPEGLTQVEVCLANGLLPTGHCRRRAREWFIAGTEPRALDPGYAAVELDAATGLAWEAGCEGPRRERTFRILPPEALEWGRQAGIALPPEQTCFGNPVGAVPRRVVSPPENRGSTSAALAARPGGPAEAEGVAAERADDAPGDGSAAAADLRITRPAPNTTFALTVQLPAALQRIELQAQPARRLDLAELRIEVDGEAVATLRRPPFRAVWALAAGEHVVRAEGRTRDGQVVSSDEVRFAVLAEEPVRGFSD